MFPAKTRAKIKYDKTGRGGTVKAPAYILRIVSSIQVSAGSSESNAP